MSMNTFSSLEMLKIAMLMEEEGFKFYRNGAKNTSGEVKDFLTIAAAQESAHKEYFSKLYDQIANEKGEYDEYLFEPEVTSYLRAIIENQVFDKNENLDAFKDFKSAVEQSVKAEELTVDVYKKMYAGIKEPKTKALMEKIIDEEVSHATYFKSLL